MSGTDWLVLAGLVATPTTPEKSPGEVYSGAFRAPPAETWRVPLPGPPFPAAVHTELGGPLIHGDHVFVGQAGTDGLHVIDRASGTLVRTVPAGAPVQAAPVVHGNLLLVSDLSGTTTAWELGDGAAVTRKWTREGVAPVLSPPAVVDGRVVVASVDNVVTAIDLDTGELVWRHAQRLDPGRFAELELYGAPTPVLAGDQLLVGFSDGTLAGLDADNGSLAWQRRVGEGQYPDILGAPVAVGDDYVVAGFTEPLVGIDARSRNVRWRLDVGGAGAAVSGGGSGPTPDGSFGGADDAFVFHGGGDGVLRCVDARTGAQLWEWDSDTSSALTTPVPTDAGLLVGAAAGSVYLVDGSSGELVWSWAPTFHVSGVTVPPSVDGRQAVIVTNAGNLVSFVVPNEPGPWGRSDHLFSRTGERVRKDGP